MATSNCHGLQAVHSVPGRTRLRFPKLKHHPDLAHDIHRKLCAIPGVQQVQANPITGSIVVHHERSAPQSVEFLLAVAAAFGLAGIAPEELSMFSEISDGEAVDLSDGIEAVGKIINDGVGQLTGGRMDTKTLIPTLLVVLGIRSLWVSNVLAAPKWYEYFWFAFGAYFTLNKPESPGDAAT